MSVLHSKNVSSFVWRVSALSMMTATFFVVTWNSSRWEVDNGQTPFWGHVFSEYITQVPLIIFRPNRRWFCLRKCPLLANLAFLSFSACWSYCKGKLSVTKSTSSPSVWPLTPVNKIDDTRSAIECHFRTILALAHGYHIKGRMEYQVVASNWKSGHKFNKWVSCARKKFKK